MKLKMFVMCMIASLFVMSCQTKQKKDKSKHVTIGYVDGWAEGVAMTHVAQQVLVEKGFEVEVKKAAVDLLFASLANGDTDVFMDAWLPVTHKEKIARFNTKLELIGVNFDNARIGLVVPKYVTIESIEELNANAEKFDHKIIGIERGAGITAKTDLVLEAYDLKLKHLTSSSIAMLTELKKAIQEKRYIVVTGWAPHWKFGRYELKFLKDPKKIYGASERIETYARKGFKADQPEAAKFFANFHLNPQQMADLLAQMQEGKDKKEVAKQWVKQHKAMIDAWLK